MFEKIDEIFRNVESIRDEIQILLNMANITLIDYIMIKRGSQDMPEGLSMSLFSQLNEQIDALKKQIDALNKLKRELLVF
ncbi:hypothetical protein BKH42_04540 [Helicobacter sp. 13S00482-2]|uniref:DUF2443 family protein n=1 Tax=Helicobacter sp. 13S00482-2 TaxID=1476200 RepID=UPI000BA57916|nr:DUF2443 family protein [Helicobacter sp. 13S00482-2]PAF53765.1 hypothetical protein BKH42_04540 [Helicobacter sp. 13S00482-2]